MLRRHWKRLAVFATVLVLVWLGVRQWRGDAVEVVQLQPRTLIQTVVTPGRVAPPFEIRLAALAAAQVLAVEVEEGERVTAGALLVAFDDAEARAQVAEAEAQVAQAQARARGVRVLDAPASLESLRQGQAELAEAESQWARTQSLFDAGTISAAERDSARTRLDLARSRVRTAELELAARRGGSALQAAQAELALAESRLAAARARLERLNLRAPADATVVRRAVEPGETVSLGTELLVLARAGGTQIIVEPDEKNLPLLALGQPALVSAEAFAAQRFAAEVSFIAPAVDRMRGTIELKLDVPEPPAYLRTDMTVSVEIEVARRERALVLPAEAVRDLGRGQPWVLVVERGRAVRREVSVGVRGEGAVEIVDGLEPGDEVVAAGETVEPAARVRAR
ncbi:efflux RND transporter periplasmic adaptor subunit [Haliangium ochraceum]|uniref:Efflux transporter, RND family, MFP subunit n=1 Tax=Haliangium ochraceum (strain DSM 14365 / JCM 11303 / SMP-2) TaxID=502025 RepID=D0LYH6_HALO1|nr:efflux RND transporter periplasmic adaptor subunit [Haliangium ochraceum]ACY17842.1 efflux transporter, RND family, MFP subunit [Haliangium ochraceum DSM 14365]